VQGLTPLLISMRTLMVARLANGKKTPHPTEG